MELEGPFYRQTKYVEWGDDVRLASGLEARYIAAEAQLKAGTPVAALALIVFIVIRNKKDRKDLLPPGGVDDVINREKMDQQRDQDKV